MRLVSSELTCSSIFVLFGKMVKIKFNYKKLMFNIKKLRSHSLRELRMKVKSVEVSSDILDG